MTYLVEDGAADGDCERPDHHHQPHVVHDGSRLTRHAIEFAHGEPILTRLAHLQSVPTAPRPLLVAIVATYVVAYGVAVALGYPLLLLKYVLIPAVAIAALRSPRPDELIRAWLPYIAIVLLMDSCRGGIYALVKMGVRPVGVLGVIALESAIARTPAMGASLQASLHSTALDIACTVLYAAHFVFFFTFGVVLWHRRPDEFSLYARAIIWSFGLGLIGYFVWPTAPPWMAAAQGALPPTQHVTEPIFRTLVPQLYASLDNNPVAAMPSLHIAFPVVCALVAIRSLGRTAGWILRAYTVAVVFAVVYLGEHYVVDVLAGAILGVAAFAVSARTRPLTRNWSLARLAGVSLALAVLSVVIDAWRV